MDVGDKERVAWLSRFWDVFVVTRVVIIFADPAVRLLTSFSFFVGW